MLGVAPDEASEIAAGSALGAVPSSVERLQFGSQTFELCALRLDDVARRPFHESRVRQLAL
jgi:hypothetical protein